MIGRKQQTSETDWHVALAAIESTVSRRAVETRMAADVVREAATLIPSAREFLRTVGAC